MDNGKYRPALQPIQQSVRVTFQYPVVFTHHLFDPDNTLLRDTLVPAPGQPEKKVLVVVDDGLPPCHPALLDDIECYAERHADVMTLVQPPLVITGGEQVKNEPEWLETIYEAVDRHGIDRHSYVVAVGGGAVLDAVGYAAATAHRGIRLVRVPTTVLSQNDSGIGVKNGINAYGKKNFIGSFAPPFAVLNDFHFLTTLHDRDWRGGIAEAVKVALLKDPAFFDYLETHADDLVARRMEPMEWIVYRCAQLHLDHIATSGDAFEQGTSRPLDFGHWAAHKLEQMTGYTVRHGEAVAIGIALDATYAHLTGLLARDAWQRILVLFRRLRLPCYHPALSQSLHDDPPLLAGLREFQEHLGGTLTIMLLEGIGHGVEVHEMDPAVVVHSIEQLEHVANREDALWTDTAIPAR